MTETLTDFRADPLAWVSRRVTDAMTITILLTLACGFSRVVVDGVEHLFGKGI